MRRAFDLAIGGIGRVSPNPMVGSVVVHEDRIIGEGWHQQFGGPHAEVNALQGIKEKHLLAKSTVYVNLEPCSHFGKTPPCADLLVKNRINKVVVSNVDPNSQVAGQGISRLKENGIEVVTGVLESEGQWLNRRYFTSITQNRPYVILKWAQTKDGFIAKEDYQSKWISNDSSRVLVHKWRSEEDAILVGANTAFHDNPNLNVRDWHGRDPVRAVIDGELKLPADLNLWRGDQKTICYNTKKENQEGNTSYVKLGTGEQVPQILAHMHDVGIQSLVVEGGSRLLTLFEQHKLWDEARIFISPQEFKNGIKAPEVSGKIMEEQEIDGDVLIFKTSR